MGNYDMPAFQFYAKDWLSDICVQLMTPAQRGVYIHLLAHLWQLLQDGRGLPLEQWKLMHIAGVKTEDDWEAIWHGQVNGQGEGTPVEQMFNKCTNKTGTLLFNKRLVQEYQYLLEKREKLSAAGRASGKSRRTKELDIEQTFNKCSTNDEQMSNTAVAAAVATSGIKKTSKEILLERFDLFWKAYPKKKSRGMAEKAWLKLKPSQELTEQIISAVESQKPSVAWLKNGGEFIKHPATWLNGKCWTDEIATEMSEHERKVAALRKAMEDNSDD